MLISPTEPFPFKSIGTVSSVPERFGADFLIMGKTVGKIGVQRKKFPEDLLSSLADGRLYTQVHQMQELDQAIVVLEGLGRWTEDGELVDIRAFTKKQLFSLVWSLSFEFGMEVFQVRGMKDTIMLLESLESWAKKEKHSSLRTRPGPKKDSWGKLGNREYGIHLLQSFPGMGPELAGRVIDHFGKVPIKWDLDGVEDLIAVKGIGKGKAEKIWEVLE